MDLSPLDIESSDAAIIAAFREAAAVLSRECSRAAAGLAVSLAGIFMRAGTTLREYADALEASARDPASVNPARQEALLLAADRALEDLSSRVSWNRQIHDSYRSVLALRLEMLHGESSGAARASRGDGRSASEHRPRLSVVRSPADAPPAKSVAAARKEPIRYLFVDEEPLVGSEPWRFPCEDLSLALLFFATRVAMYTSMRGNPGALVIIDTKTGRVLRSTRGQTAADVARYLAEPAPEPPSVRYPRPTRVR